MFFKTMDTNKAAVLHPLVLAYVGDAVFSLYIREKLVENTTVKSGGLHKKSVDYVSARGQAVIYDRITGILTETEADIARRARNAHSNTKAKNTDFETYKKSSSLEALIGYLYLTGQQDRMCGIIEKGIEEQKG